MSNESGVKFVVSRDGKEGCRHMRASVRWPDGKLTYPCWGGMEMVSEDTAKIVG